MVKAKLGKVLASKTKYLESEIESEDKPEDESDSSGVVRMQKKVPASKSGKKIRVVDDSSDEVEKKKKAKKRHVSSEEESSDEEDRRKKGKKDKKLKKKENKKKESKKRVDSESSEDSSEEIEKKKKKKKDKKKKDQKKKDKKRKQTSSDSSEEEPKLKKRKPKDSSEESDKLKKNKTKYLEDSSESDPKPKKSKPSSKKPKPDSDEEPKKKPKKFVSSSEDLPKKKSQRSSNSEDFQVIPSSHPQKFTKKVAPESSSDDPYKTQSVSKQSNTQLPKPKPKEKIPSPESSPSSPHSSDADEQELLLQKKTKPKPELPIKRKAPEATPAALPPAPLMRTEPRPGTSSFPGDVELFIGGLAYEATEDDLQTLFSQFGDLAHIKIPQKNGSPSGIAFISYINPENAQKALGLNNTQFMNRVLRVSFTSNKGARPAASNAASATVFVGNIPYTSTEETIAQFFSQCGDVKQVRLAKLPTGELKGFGHVEFFDTDSAGKAVKFAGTNLEGRPIKVEYAAEKSRGGPEAPRPARPMVSQHFAGQKIKL